MSPSSDLPVRSFSALALSPELQQVVAELGFSQMTPIQAESIPHLLAGKDLIGQSQTGSGKTAAFSLPILEKLDVTSPRRRLQALILSPTRELCTQVAREIRRLGRKYAGLQVLIVSGGQPLPPQARALEQGAHIVVGTPGRLLDHLSRRTLDLSSVTTVVLDEADRMLDMGFAEDMETILADVPSERQTMLFSATFPRTIESISRRYQRDPVRVTIATSERSAPSITQEFFEVEEADKTLALIQLLEQIPADSVVVFCNLKATVASLHRALAQAGISAAGLHGDLEQFDRDRVMARFRNRSLSVLIATDVAARGIDVENLDIVYNFDLPSTPDVYVHRIGRTGRAGKSGRSITFVNPRQKPRLGALSEQTGQTIQLKPFDYVDVEVSAESEVAGPVVPVTKLAAAMETLRISGGRKEKVRPGDILGALTGEAGGLNAADVGKIEIHDHFAYVAVSKSVAAIALKRLSEGKIKGRKFQIHWVR